MTIENEQVASFVSGALRPLCEQLRDLKIKIDELAWEDISPLLGNNMGAEVNETRVDDVPCLTVGEVHAIMAVLLDVSGGYIPDIESACVRNAVEA